MVFQNIDSNQTIIKNEELNSQEIDHDKRCLPRVTTNITTTNILWCGSSCIVIESKDFKRAIKKPIIHFNNPQITIQSISQIKNEIKILKRISKYNHPKIVEFLKYSDVSVKTKNSIKPLILPVIFNFNRKYIMKCLNTMDPWVRDL